MVCCLVSVVWLVMKLEEIKDILAIGENTELYDDRVQVKENLMVAYRSIMAFVRKHLPEKPYIENMQRFSLRDKIMREVILNMLIHREYSSAYPTSFTIWADKVVTENWNVPYVYGEINMKTLKPHRKNPTIANVVSQMGIVEELGSGTKKMFKYTPLYSNGRQPMIEEQDVYSVIIPLEPVKISQSPSQSPSQSLSRALNNLLSWEQVQPMFEMLQVPSLAKDMRAIYDMSDHTYFKKNYIDPFLAEGIFAMTKPETPKSRVQKYYLTELGKEILEIMKRELLG